MSRRGRRKQEGQTPAVIPEGVLDMAYTRREDGTIDVQEVSLMPPPEPLRGVALLAQVVKALANADPVARALNEMGLQADEVASYRQTESGKVVLLTRGGVKLTWPDDIEKAKGLTYGQRTGLYVDGKNPNSKAWSEPPEKNPALVAAVEKAKAKEQKG